MSGRRFLSSERGSASVEFALVLPMLIVLMFGGFEAGYFIWMQHKVTDAVRDGARYASRLPIGDFCDGATAKNDATSATDKANIRLLTRTGQLVDTAAPPKVAGWTDAQVTADVQCAKFVDTGIYTDLGSAGPVVIVSAVNVPYPSLLHGLGVRTFASIKLNATSDAAVIGI